MPKEPRWYKVFVTYFPSNRTYNYLFDSLHEAQSLLDSVAHTYDTLSCDLIWSDDDTRLTVHDPIQQSIVMIGHYKEWSSPLWHEN